MHDNGEVEESMDCYFVDREGLDPMLSRVRTIDKEYSVEEEKLDLSFWVVLSELLSKGPRDSRFRAEFLLCLSRRISFLTLYRSSRS